MKAMIFAAGKGTRLKPITNQTPKALVKIGGQPMLWHVLKQMERANVKEVVVNVHHLGHKIEEFLSELDTEIKCIVSREYDELLETGGGLKKAIPLLKTSEPFFIANADILSDLDFVTFKSLHSKLRPLVTLVVNERESTRKLLFNREGILCGWANKVTGEKIISRNSDELVEKSFCGIHIAEPELLDMITESGKFSILKTYLRLAENHEIRYYEQPQLKWIDIGTPEKLAEAEAIFG